VFGSHDHPTQAIVQHQSASMNAQKLRIPTFTDQCLAILQIHHHIADCRDAVGPQRDTAVSRMDGCSQEDGSLFPRGFFARPGFDDHEEYL
jgi:hypothetical protein